MRLTFLLVLGFLLDTLHFSLYVILLPVVSNYVLQGLCVLYPLNQASISAQRHDGICSEVKVPLSCFSIILKHFVAKYSKVDEALFFSQISIFVALEQEAISLSVGAYYANLLWLLF